jgi:UDP-2-acetamido-3-amino-2,3-dideoxy-glucuronate N-acetyltransferase
MIWHFATSLGLRSARAPHRLNVVTGPRRSARTSIQNNVSVYVGVTLEDDVFCGRRWFTNILTPRSAPQPQRDNRPTLVKRATSGQTRQSLRPHDRRARAGRAGSVVNKDAPPYAVVVGNWRQHDNECIA